VCIADNVASAGEEQIEVLTQSPGATDVNATSERPPRSIGELPNSSTPSSSRSLMLRLLAIEKPPFHSNQDITRACRCAVPPS